VTARRRPVEFLDETLAFWQPRSPRPLSREDGREIAANLTEFFQVLSEWEAARDTVAQSRNESNT
jgi:hypothetical protein